MSHFLIKSKFKDIVLLLLCISAFLYLSVVFIFSNSIWFDEGFTVFLIKLPPSQIIHYTSLDVHPPLYYLLLKIWALIFNYQLFSLRYFSLFCGVLCIIAMHFLLKIIAVIFRSKSSSFLSLSFIARFFALLIFATNSFFITHASEARMYSLVLLLAIILITILLKICHSSKNKPSKYYYFFALISLLGISTHYYFAILIIICFTYFILSQIVLKNTANTINRHLFLAIILLIVGYSPWIKTAIGVSTDVQKGFWTHGRSFIYILDFFTHITLFVPYNQNKIHEYIIASALIITICILPIFKIAKLNTECKLLYFFFICLTIFGVIIIDCANLYSPRYIIWSLIGFCGLIIISLQSFGFSYQNKMGTFVKHLPLTLNFVIILMFVSSTAIISIPNLFKWKNYNPDANKMPQISNVINDILEDKSANSQTDIIVSNFNIFYDVDAYSSQNITVYATKDGYQDLWDMPASFKMIPELKSDYLIDRPEQFISTHQNVWIIINYGETLNHRDDILFKTKHYQNGRLIGEKSYPYI